MLCWLCSRKTTYTIINYNIPWKSSRYKQSGWALKNDPWIKDSRSYQWGKFGHVWSTWTYRVYIYMSYYMYIQICKWDSHTTLIRIAWSMGIQEASLGDIPEFFRLTSFNLNEVTTISYKNNDLRIITCTECWHDCIPGTFGVLQLFQLDVSKLQKHKKWLEITNHPFKPGCLGFQVHNNYINYGVLNLFEIILTVN